MSYSTQGASNRQIYDCCAYAQALQQSVDPLQYELYFGAVENCNKCVDKKAWFKQDKEIIDIESDLWNINRPLTRCDGYKYNPNCKTGPNCISTFDSNAPKVLSPSLCPIVYNNIPVQTSPGYSVPDPANVCLTNNNYRVADETNTFQQWDHHNKMLLGNNSDPQNVFMFMNSCSNKPLYQGGMENVRPYMANTFESGFVYNSNNVPLSRVPDETFRMQQMPQRTQMESRMNVQRTEPMGMRLPTLATKGRTGVSPKQLFDSDNDSVYDSDGEFGTM